MWQTPPFPSSGKGPVSTVCSVATISEEGSHDPLLCNFEDVRIGPWKEANPLASGNIAVAASTRTDAIKEAKGGDDMRHCDVILDNIISILSYKYSDAESNLLQRMVKEQLIGVCDMKLAQVHATSIDPQTTKG